MTILAPIMMFGWPVFGILLFSRLKPRHAALASLIGAWLFLPVTTYDLPGIPAYSKTAAASLGILLGIILFDTQRLVKFRFKIYDLPMVIWCLCSIATSLSNQLGIYDGLSGAFKQVLEWGIPYLVGRIYFDSQEALKDLAVAIVIGGLIYVPLCLFEIRMSPQLSNIFYGFFAHSWVQCIRYGGYRPIVFMQHPLMVALWMALSSTITFWLWRSREVQHILGVPMAIFWLLLAFTTILCKSGNGWFALATGTGSYYLYQVRSSPRIFKFLILAIIGYVFLRSTGLWDAQILPDIISKYIDPARAQSLTARLLQEDLFSRWTMRRLWLGWGGYGRNRPLDMYTGQMILQTIDSMWLIAFSTFGVIGLTSLFGAMFIGPWLALTSQSRLIDQERTGIEVVILCLVVILFMIDGLANGMENPVYLMTSGGLLSFALLSKRQAIEEISESFSVLPPAKGIQISSNFNQHGMRCNHR